MLPLLLLGCHREEPADPRDPGGGGSEPTEEPPGTDTALPTGSLPTGTAAWTGDLDAADADAIVPAPPNEGWSHFVDAGDVDGDGTGDVLVDAFPHGTWLLKGPPDGTNPPRDVGELLDSPTSFGLTNATPSSAAADLDSDGWREVVLPVSEVGELSDLAVLAGSAAGFSADVTASPRLLFEDRMQGVVAGELTGDSADDLLLAGSDDSTLSVWILPGPVVGGAVSSLAASTLQTEALIFPGIGSLGDVTGDDLPDVVVWTPGQAGYLIGKAILFDASMTGTFAEVDTPGTFTGSIWGVWPVGDLTGDGLVDAAVTTGATMLLVAGGTPWAGDPADVAVARMDSAAGTMTYDAVAVESLDGDGRSDLAVGMTDYPNSGKVVVFGDFAGTVSEYDALVTISLERPAQDIATSDRDGDGFREFVVKNLDDSGDFLAWFTVLWPTP